MNRIRSSGRGMKRQEKSPQRFSKENSRLACFLDPLLEGPPQELIEKNLARGGEKILHPYSRRQVTLEFLHGQIPGKEGAILVEDATSELVNSRNSSTPYWANKPDNWRNSWV